MAASDVVITIGASTANLKPALAAANDTISAWGRGVRVATVDAEKGFKSLGESMKKFASEERSEGRAAGFFVSEITRIVPASEAAKVGLGALAEVMIGGAGLGAAMAIVAAGAEVVSTLLHDQENALKTAREAALRHVTALESVAAIESRTRLLGISPGIREEIALFDRTAAELRKLKREYAELEAQRDEAVRKRDAKGIVQARTKMDENLAEQKAIREQMRAEEKRIDDEQDLSIARAEHALELERTAGEEQRIRADYSQRISEVEQEIARKLKDETLGHLEINRLIEERKNKLQAILDKQEAARALAPRKSLEEIDASLGGWEGQSKPNRFTGHEPTALDQQRFQDYEAPVVGDDGRIAGSRTVKSKETMYGSSASEYADSFSAVEIAMAGTEEQHKAASRARQEEQKQIASLAAAYQQWGSVAGTVIGGIVTGHKTIGESAAQVGQLIIQEVVKTAISSITADAARAGAGAAASQAGIPVIGPVLAISAMGAIMSQVIGLLGNLPSAAGGWQVPYDTLAMVHKDEKILPARYARGLDRLVKSGGGGTNITIHAVDAKNVERMARDNGSAFTRALRLEDRRRRLRST